MKTTKRKRGLQDEKKPPPKRGSGYGGAGSRETRDAQWSRGAYLVEHLGHCGECHTPRDFLGAKDEDRKLAGNPKGPDGKKVPNITPDPEDGIGRWRAGDLNLKTGFRPDGDVAGGAMSGVIEDATAHLSDADRAAIAAYLSSLPPIPRQ